MRRLQTFQRTRTGRGCGQGRDGVAYYTETVNNNVCLFKVCMGTKFLHNFHDTICPLRDNRMNKTP